VLATDPVTGLSTAEPVLDVYASEETRNIVDIDGLEATAEHPLWVEGYGWKTAAKVQPGDRLLSPDGTLTVVSRVENKGWVPETTAVNLSVGDVHTYTVLLGQQFEVLTHNIAMYVCPHGRRQGSKFTAAGKRWLVEHNKKLFGGVNRCERCGVRVVRPKKSKSGVTPSRREWQSDHRKPRARGGVGCTRCNGSLLCRVCNRLKWF
jgi:hypothetical protein